MIDVDKPWLRELQKKCFDYFLANEASRWQKIIGDGCLLQSQASKNKPNCSGISSDFLSQHRLSEKRLLLVFVDGFFCADLSDKIRQDSGVEISRFSDALQVHENFCKKYFSDFDYKTQELSSLNVALMQDGLFLKVKQDAVISDPVQLLFISTKKSALFINAHNLLVVEKGAKVTFFEKHVSFEENNGFANFFTSINAAESTEVNYFKLQPRGINAKHVANLQISPEKQSKIKCSYILDGSLFSEDHIFIKLHHENVACDLTGLYVVKESEHLKLALRIEHDASNCVSKTLFKGVIDDDASADFSGRVFVAKDTIKNEAHLTDKNLLLSDSAKIKTSPELEIYADDVNCSHGATVGQLDEQMLFYLQSRGIEKAVAQEMLIAAFIDEITESWKPFIII